MDIITQLIFQYYNGISESCKQIWTIILTHLDRSRKVIKRNSFPTDIWTPSYQFFKSKT